MSLDTLPCADGFRMPGEHEPQQAVLMIWPERPDNWRDNARHAQQQFVEVASAIAEVTPVFMCVNPDQINNARAQLPASVTVLDIASDDSWMRDVGPTYVINDAGKVRGVDWQFNAWGGELDGLYSPWDRDAAVAEGVLELRGEDRYAAPLILEGGSIHVDGEGTLYTTEECLLHPSRNPGLSRGDIEALLADYLSVEKFIWLKRGLYNDETNGHVDNLLHVVSPGEVVLSWCDDVGDPMYEICREAWATLSGQNDARGREIIIHKLPIPGPLYMSEEEFGGLSSSGHANRRAGERLGGSYVNFLISNGRIICPQLDPARDQQAIDILQALFPAHEVVGVNSREILLGGGNIHCITQHIPRG
ncbi:MAG: agmatine deiminase [Halieaceae bacterium]